MLNHKFRVIRNIEILAAGFYPPFFLTAPGEGDLPMANQGDLEEHVSNGLEY